MIVHRRLAKSLFKESLRTPTICQVAKFHNRDRIGNRDWVGFGKTGCANYVEDPCFPFPSVRFKENTNELFALREKEKGDWRKLSVEEKKILYRASFRQTLVECSAPTGLWKQVIGVVLFAISAGIWIWFSWREFLYDPFPETFSEEYRKATLRTMLDLKMGHFKGVSSKWDYEKDDWK